MKTETIMAIASAMRLGGMMGLNIDWGGWPIQFQLVTISTILTSGYGKIFNMKRYSCSSFEIWVILLPVCYNEREKHLAHIHKCIENFFEIFK